MIGSFLTQAWAQESPLWLRYPAISPDGQQIVFSYQGDLYRVSSSGGTATALTHHPAYDYMPVWSPDGQQIAFTSDRFGNFDVFVVSASGGTPQRLTFHSAGDFPSDFSPDGQAVMFTSARLDAASNRQFPSGVLPELYQVGINGGRVKQVLTVPAELARISPDGRKIIYHDRKGYEDSMRKHHTSSVTRDVWIYDTQAKSFAQLSDFAGEDRNPVFAPNQQEIFYLSEEKGSFNVFKMPVDNPTARMQITSFEKHPLRSLSIARNGTLCYSFNGEIYTQNANGSPQKVAIQLFADAQTNATETVPVREGATEMAVSPNGKEIAFVVRGEIFVSSVESGLTKRITNTPEQERSISFSPDGRAILYAGERNQSWNLYQTKIARAEEKYFFNATLLKEEPVLVSPAETFQPQFSPNGEEVAYLENRTTLKVLNLKTQQSRVIVPGDKNYSYSDGDQYYAWSPDGKWFLVEFLQNQQWTSEVGLVSAEGGKEIINLTQSGYSDNVPRWAQDGQMILWFSDRDGMKNHASWGAESDVYGMFLTQEAYDKFLLNEEEAKLAQEAQSEEKKESPTPDPKAKTSPETKSPKALKIDWEGLEQRKKRLTIHSSLLSDALVSRDGEHLYYLARFEKGFDLWTTNLRTRETKILVKLGASNGGALVWDSKAEQIFMISDGNLFKINPKDGKKENIRYQGEMRLQRAEERAYLFEHMWRQVRAKFYLPELHQTEWDFYKKEYARFLPHIQNNYDFAEMMSELLGELNASHTGCRYSPQTENADQTASLGVFYEEGYAGKGLKIAEIMKGSPLLKAGTKIKAGVIIEKIDGQEITPTTNPYALLNRKAGHYTLLSLFDEKTAQRWEETIKPISLGEENELRYQRWVETNRDDVEKLSGGKIGYVHVRGMNDGSFRTVYEEVLGKNYEKQALIVDTRFNGGGWLHDDLATFLNGQRYLDFVPRGQNIGSEPQFKWKKPSVVVMSESNYSDAHMFPFVYKQMKIGQLVGMPVPGTGTAVWWERLQDPTLVFGIPQVGMRTLDGKWLENTQLEPDVKAMNRPETVSKGEDTQIKKAVEILMGQL